MVGGARGQGDRRARRAVDDERGVHDGGGVERFGGGALGHRVRLFKG